MDVKSYYKLFDEAQEHGCKILAHLVPCSHPYIILEVRLPDTKIVGETDPRSPLPPELQAQALLSAKDSGRWSWPEYA